MKEKLNKLNEPKYNWGELKNNLENSHFYKGVLYCTGVYKDFDQDYHYNNYNIGIIIPIKLIRLIDREKDHTFFYIDSNYEKELVLDIDLNANEHKIRPGEAEDCIKCAPKDINKEGGSLIQVRDEEGTEALIYNEILKNVSKMANEIFLVTYQKINKLKDIHDRYNEKLEDLHLHTEENNVTFNTLLNEIINDKSLFTPRKGDSTSLIENIVDFSLDNIFGPVYLGQNIIFLDAYIKNLNPWADALIHTFDAHVELSDFYNKVENMFSNFFPFGITFYTSSIREEENNELTLIRETQIIPCRIKEVNHSEYITINGEKKQKDYVYQVDLLIPDVVLKLNLIENLNLAYYRYILLSLNKKENPFAIGSYYAHKPELDKITKKERENIELDYFTDHFFIENINSVLQSIINLSYDYTKLISKENKNVLNAFLRGHANLDKNELIPFSRFYINQDFLKFIVSYNKDWLNNDIFIASKKVFLNYFL
jgi:hypothetical protein